jgi:hypothetical protein
MTDPTASLSEPPPPVLATAILRRLVSSFTPTEPPADFFNALSTESGDRPLVVDRLLRENPWEKAALAEVYLKRVVRESGPSPDHSYPHNTAWTRIWKPPESAQFEPRPPVIFIESGSTCAYVSEVLRAFAVETSKTLGPFSLTTNNNLTAWLFLDSDTRSSSTAPAHSTSTTDAGSRLVPYLFAGHLEAKYHGLFPFHKQHRQDRHEEEQQAYAHLRLALARSDLLLLAASRLSLIHGPLVGSRENAIFKNACYNACVPKVDGTSTKEIHLFIAVQKLVAHNDRNQELAESNRTKTESPFYGFHSWAEEYRKTTIEECFPAFTLRSSDPTGGLAHARHARAAEGAIRSPFHSLITGDPARLRDGTSAVDMGTGGFRVCDTWEELFTKARMTVRVFIAFRGDNNEYLRWIQDEVSHAAAVFGNRIGFDADQIGTISLDGSTFSLLSIAIRAKQ